MLSTAVALRHVSFENFGTFEAVLTAAGYTVHYDDVGVHELWTLEPLKTELVIVLVGPIGVYETEAYPFFAEEPDFLRTRLDADRPTFGICLGAELIATALGAKVKPSGAKEIGFAPLTLTSEGETCVLRHLAEILVLHWHGDMFAIPEGTDRLVETAACVNQGLRPRPQRHGRAVPSPGGRHRRLRALADRPCD